MKSALVLEPWSLEVAIEKKATSVVSSTGMEFACKNREPINIFQNLLVEHIELMA